MAPHGRRSSAGRLLWRLRGLATRTRERAAQTVRTAPDTIVLDDVRRRLELMLCALHGRVVRVHDAAVPDRTLKDRVAGLFTPRHLRDHPVAWTDGDTVLLPPRLAHPRGDPSGVAHYRLLALVQADRIMRGTATLLHGLTDPLERDLFLLRESMAVDARVARDVSSVATSLADARRSALLARPPLTALSASERELEVIVREALDPQAAERHRALADTTPADSLAWASALRATLRGPYRGLAPVAHWGGAPTNTQGPTTEPETGNPFAPRDGIYQFESRMTESGGEGTETELPDPTSEGDTFEDPRGSADATSDVARDTDTQSASPGGPRSHDAAGAPPDEEGRPPDDPGPGVQYPEWDDNARRYRRDAVMVRERVAIEAGSNWASDTLRQHAPMVRSIRERFEPLRARRMRLNQQREGEELDLQACVQAMIDVRTGHTPSDRLYASVRPARRAMTICLLVDVSGSTETPLPNGQRIVDVERQATLFASEALDALGDDYALLTFSSRGARNVRIGTLKDFQERNGPVVRQRIAGIEPGENTRLGAAVRHAAARLTAQPAGRRLLLILSDGRPNDFDGYYEAAGAEDSRHAINDARAQGIFPFCITIDREEGPEYLPRIFGANGYTVLRSPEQLPLALVRVVRQLLAK
jgi:nitric oxide reductase NorD protein